MAITNLMNHERNDVSPTKKRKGKGEKARGKGGK